MIGNALLVSQAAERDRQAATVAPHTTGSVEGYDEHLRPTLTEVLLPVTQLRQMLRSMESAEPAEKHQDDRTTAIIRQADWLAIRGQQLEIGSGVAGT